MKGRTSYTKRGSAKQLSRGQEQLAAVVLAAGTRPPRRNVCIVTEEIAGPDFNGGIGSANWGLALALRAEGYDVDVLYTRVHNSSAHCFRGSFASQVEAFSHKGIKLRCIYNQYDWDNWGAKSFRTMEFLIENPYDIVFFNDTHGAAYYPLLARKTGNIALANSLIFVVTHSCTQWIQEINEGPITSASDIKLMELERRSIELADCIISPSRYLINKYLGYGWKLPDRIHIVPNILEQDKFGGGGSSTIKIGEIVFFGRLEARKGLWLFCNTLDRIKDDLTNCKVTFLGKSTVENNEPTSLAVLRRAAGWPFEIRMLNNFSRDQALDYLRGTGRLAVMPSLQDNSPCVIVECAERSIPFIATSGSGGEELLSPSTREECLCAPSVEALTTKLQHVLRDGISAGCLAFDPEEVRTKYLELIEEAVAQQKQPREFELVKSRQRKRPVLFAIAPSNLGNHEVKSKAQRIYEDFQQNVDLNIVALGHSDITKLLSGTLSSKDVRLLDGLGYSSMVDDLEGDSEAVVGVFHIQQPITLEWWDRAMQCMESNLNLQALAGLTSILEPDIPSDLPDYMYIPSGRHVVQRFLVGNSPTLLPLSRETNSGFAMLRGDALSSLVAVTPVDVRYGRLKRVADWIHELFTEMSGRGVQFEIIPDCALSFEETHEDFETFGLGNYLRSLCSTQMRYGAGSDQALLARLGIERAWRDERLASAVGCLSEISLRLGVKAESLATFDVSSNQTLVTLARMAHAAGQIDLSQELMVEVTAQNRRAHSSHLPTLAELARAHANDIGLYEAVKAGRYRTLNLDHNWSFEVHEDQTFRIHPNPPNEGRATVIFPGVDLRNVDSFEASLALPNAHSCPVRFRISLAACDGTSHLDFDRVVTGSETSGFEFAVPEVARALSDVILTTEMVRHFDTTRDAWANFIRPIFFRLESD